MKISEKSVSYISVTCVCMLLFIWVLPDTIALRNIILGLGAIAGIFLIHQNWNCFSRPSLKLLPLYLVLGLFIWVLVHYTFFSLNRALELSEIKSLWLRAFGGVLMAAGVACALTKNRNLQKYFFFSLFFVPIINLTTYGYASFLKGTFIKPNDFVRFLFIKIETTYFGAIASAFAIANLLYMFIFNKQEKQYLKITFYLLGLALVLVSALVVGTKNGVAISIALCLFFGVVLMLDMLIHSRNISVVSIVVCLLVVLLTGLVWKGHKASAYEGWDTIFSDAKVAIQTDKYRQWQKGEHEFIRPTNENGTLVVGNTYFRIAWATVGTKLIASYPLGYGSINRSFVGLLDEAKIEHVHQGQVHSGWIDFGLAFGIPGLVLLFSAMICIIVLGLSRPSFLNICSAMTCVALIPMGIIAEISYKQYFEATIFFVAMAASFIALDDVPQNVDIAP